MIVSEISLVISAKQDQRNVGLSAAESFGDFSLGHRTGQCSDFSNFFLGQELFEPQSEGSVDGVLLVEPIINPFKVRGEAIRLHAIDMIDHRQVIRIWDESDSDESMDVDRLSVTISPEASLRISNAIDARSENLSIAPLRTVWSATHSINASNATEVANFVKVAEIGEMNRSPFFYQSDIHVVGYLSDVSGLMIKDPPHAATFGGSAFMASTSEDFNRSYVDAR